MPEDRPAHEWYRFVLSYPPHLVRDYLEKFDVGAGQRVLDPFCGTGTTLVECKKRGIESVGIEANPMAQLACRVKTNWSISADKLKRHAESVADEVLEVLASQGIRDDGLFTNPAKPKGGLRVLTTEQAALILRDSISPIPLHKTLELIQILRQRCDPALHGHEQVALASALVSEIGNLHFGPEVGVGPAKKDTAVIHPWLTNVCQMSSDLKELKGRSAVLSQVHCADARRIEDFVEPESIDAVITSPPYPNEKDYTRTTRLESVLLGLIQDKAGLKALKQGLLRSNTRNVYKNDDDDRWISDIPEIQRIAATIEARRIELGKTSGFERLYARVTKLYFGGMMRHLESLSKVLRPGAKLAYVVGDQASYLRVMIRTGQLIAQIAVKLGYEVEGIDLFRTRLATATREQLREEVVVLRWTGKRHKNSSLRRIAR